MTKNSKKKTTKNTSNNNKTIIRFSENSDKAKIIWVYDKIDRNGRFAFDLNRPDFYHKEFLDKMIQYSNMTWTDIKRQTHDNGKSKHHFISENKLSKEIQERITFLHLSEYSDSIFSFAFLNQLRILGIRENEHFHAIWYDSCHEACPSKKKHT